MDPTNTTIEHAFSSPLRKVSGHMFWDGGQVRLWPSAMRCSPYHHFSLVFPAGTVVKRDGFVAGTHRGAFQVSLQAGLLVAKNKHQSMGQA